MVAKPDSQDRAPTAGPGEATLDEVSFAWLDAYAEDDAPRCEHETVVNRAFAILSAIERRK